VSQPKIVLYGIVETPYTQKVIRALRFKGLAYELHEPASPEDIRRWSPETGLLPVAEIDGKHVADSEAILDEIERVLPEPRLLARDPKQAREQRRLASWVGETFRFYMVRWIAARFGRQVSGTERDEHGHAMGPMARLGLIDEDGKLVREAFDTSQVGFGPEFERRLDDLVAMLGEREWFVGSALSRADLAVASSIGNMYTDRYPGSRALLERYPTLVRHFERVAAATGGTDPLR
jgi:glutathione S-transferase